jgi:hypothetical protein
MVLAASPLGKKYLARKACPAGRHPPVFVPIFVPVLTSDLAPALGSH